ncbi:hypothetical protein Pcinc_004891 [Petrolisthes cinctipes]|uniref:Peptidase A1 domain-containing protein n=1 Tax=Petrolisthes cinctipes TaxID=88211 RepID=A0AAE1GDR2_PETCI|nr:hypothetical protein Pcinc_004891 [Petrolisthes cinctipes]
MKNSSTYQDTEQEVNVVYTQGSWKGHMGRDIVRFPDLPEALPVITDIAIITTSNKFFVNNSHWQGIVGLAYRALSQPQGKSVPWLDGVLTQQQHLNNTITLKLCGPDKREAYASHYGHLFIGSDQGDCPPPVVTTPVKRAWFYEVLVVEIEVGNRSINLPCVSYNTDKSIVDSGTSNLLLPPKVFQAVVAELQSHTVSLIPSLSEEFWVGNEEVCWPEDHQAWDVFPNITVHLAYDNTSAFSIIVPPKSYLRPAQDKDSTCWVIGLDQSHTGTVLGTVVLEGLCLTFHRDRSIIGFSESTCGPPITLGNVEKSSVDFESCVYVSRGVSGLTLASYIMGALLGLTGLPLILATIRFACRWNVSPRLNHEVPFSTLDDVST